MAYPTGLLGIVLNDIDRRIANLKIYCAARISQYAAGNSPITWIFQMVEQLQSDRAYLVTAAATPGIVQYARDQKDDQALDVVAEFNALIAAIDATLAWVGTNIPKDGSGWLLVQTISNGAVVDRTFTPAQTAGLRTALQGIVDQIA